jgi:multidrug resistance efflux pump
MHEAPTYLPSDEPVTTPRSFTKKRIKSDSVITSAPRAIREPAALPPAPSVAAPMPQPPLVQLPGGGTAFDPLSVPLPPELAPNVYSWLRRLALQADLAGADQLLRDALADLTSSLSVVLVYAGPDGLHSLGGDDELPKDQQAIQAVARSRRALATSHTAIVPIATASETIAVILLTRNAHQNEYTLLEHVLMAAVARESAGIMHHLVVQHLQRRTELEADKKSLYRPEALDSHRRRGHEGVIAELSPGWVRRTYQVLSVCMGAAIVFATLVHVPTYSAGTGVVYYEGTPVAAPSPGTVDAVYVQGGQLVRKDDLLVKLSSAKEDADLATATAQLEKSEQAYLIDASDETTRKQLIEAQQQTARAQAAVDQKTVRAPKDGMVPQMRLRPGMAVQFGDPIATISEQDTTPEVWAFMPGGDRPRLHVGQTLQVELAGFTKAREKAVIYDVGRDVFNANEARRILGPEVGVKLPDDGSFVLVKAKLPGRTFKSDHKTMYYHHGMSAKTEVRVESKRFIVTLLPDLEKYL